MRPSICPLCWQFRNGSKLEQAGESKSAFPKTARLAASTIASNNESGVVQGVKTSPVELRIFIVPCLVFSIQIFNIPRLLLI